MAEDVGLTQPLRVCRPSQPHSGCSDHRLLDRPPDVLAYADALSGSSPLIIVLIKKKRPVQVSCSLWRRMWDSNPRGFHTLLAFQASSLAARSILQGTYNNLSQCQMFCKCNFSKQRAEYSAMLRPARFNTYTGRSQGPACCYNQSRRRLCSNMSIPSHDHSHTVLRSRFSNRI